MTTPLPSLPTAAYHSPTPLLVTLFAYPTPTWDNLHGVPVGLPADPTPEQVAYARRTYQAWRQHMPARPEDGTGDVEDFWEMAARLDAALASGATRVLVSDHIGRREGTDRVRDITPEALLSVDIFSEERFPDMNPEIAYGSVVEVPTTVPSMMVHYGPIPQGSSLWASIHHGAEDYAKSATFVTHAGRRTALVGFNLDRDLMTGEPNGPAAPVVDEAEEVMASWAADGVGKVVIKACRAKHGIWRLATSTDPAVNREALQHALGWSLVHHEGLPGAYLLQESIEMTYEYRVFIVDGRPITGAGCVEEHTPLFAHHTDHPVDWKWMTAFSSLMREHRAINLDRTEDDLIGLGDADPELDPIAGEGSGYGSPVVENRDLVERYLDFAVQVAADAAVEGTWPRAYVIDLALNPATDEVVLIEANGLSNSGLYATQPALVTRALMTTPS